MRWVGDHVHGEGCWILKDIQFSTCESLIDWLIDPFYVCAQIFNLRPNELKKQIRKGLVWSSFTSKNRTFVAGGDCFILLLILQMHICECGDGSSVLALMQHEGKDMRLNHNARFTPQFGIISHLAHHQLFNFVNFPSIWSFSRDVTRCVSCSLLHISVKFQLHEKYQKYFIRIRNIQNNPLVWETS